MHLTLKGSFDQYNWISEKDIPDTSSLQMFEVAFSGILKSIFSNKTYVYTYNDLEYINPGIIFLSENININKNDAEKVISDLSGNDYIYVQEDYLGKEGCCYLAKATMGSDESINNTESSYVPCNYDTLPKNEFDFINKNYIEKTSNDEQYCFYDNTSKQVKIKGNKTIGFEWDPFILTVTKQEVLNYSVSVDNKIYNNGEKVKLIDPGIYTIHYSYTDPYNYDKKGDSYSRQYEVEVILDYSIIVDTIHPNFTYKSNYGEISSKTVNVNNKTYVMPDISATTSEFGSRIIGEEIIYYPIVKVSATDVSGNVYKSGKTCYYYAPAFNVINITDFNQENGSELYIYDTKTNKWPHGYSQKTKFSEDLPNYGFEGVPWPTNAVNVRTHKNALANFVNNLGLCFATDSLNKPDSGKRGGCTRDVEFWYKSTDGITYYYFIQYVFEEVTYDSSGCVVGDTLITMADGTQKPIKDIKVGSVIKTWNFEIGEYENMPVTYVWDYGVDSYTVINLEFSDDIQIKLISQHELFATDTNEFVNITQENYKQFIGRTFAYSDGNCWRSIKLIDAYTDVETTGMYSLMTACDINSIANGFLSQPTTDIPNFFKYFEINEEMKYDNEKMQEDINTYGLAEYYDWEFLGNYQTFVAFNGKYFNILIGKGIATKQDIINYAIEYTNNKAN